MSVHKCSYTVPISQGSNSTEVITHYVPIASGMLEEMVKQAVIDWIRENRAQVVSTVSVLCETASDPCRQSSAVQREARGRRSRNLKAAALKYRTRLTLMHTSILDLPSPIYVEYSVHVRKSS